MKKLIKAYFNYFFIKFILCAIFVSLIFGSKCDWWRIVFVASFLALSLTNAKYLADENLKLKKLTEKN